MKNKFVLTLRSILVVGFISLSFTTCDLLNSLLGDNEGKNEFSPTNNQMISALKEALSTGSNDAGATLSVVGAFNNNPARRIPLPPEAETAIGALNSLPIPSVNIPGFTIPGVPNVNTLLGQIGGQKLEDLKTSINASAEKASEGVANAFRASITSMTIQDALTILKGEKGTEATEYLEATTKTPLKAAFKLVLDPVLDTPIILDVSANEAWTTVITYYNDFALKYNTAVDVYNSIPALLLPNKTNFKKLDPINTDLGDFVLEKALTAVFTEMAVVEKKIRDDPLGFISDVLGALTDITKKVFDWAKNAIGI